MTRAEILSLLEEHRDAFKRRDADRLAAAHDEDGSFESPAHGVVTGRKSILEVYRYWFTAFPDLQLTWDEPIVDGNRAAIFWLFAGTSHGSARPTCSALRTSSPKRSVSARITPLSARMASACALPRMTKLVMAARPVDSMTSASRR